MTAAPARSLANNGRGRFGEDEAARWYRRHGYEVLDRNWRGNAGELDLVVAGPDVTVFVEVKARASARFGVPQEAVGPVKQRRIRALAAEWLGMHPHGRRRLRFDVVAVTGTDVVVIEAAF